MHQGLAGFGIAQRYSSCVAEHVAEINPGFTIELLRAALVIVHARPQRRFSGSEVEPVITSQASRFKETEIPAPIEDDVVQECDADDRSRRFELTRYFNIGRGRLKATARVIVGDDDR